MLIGELVPYGAASNRIRPLEFLREMACVNRRYRPFRGKAARKRGCDNFRAVPGSGLAHHPYTLAGGPNVDAEHRDDVTIGNLPRLVKALNRLGRKNRLKRDADEDLGHGVRLPDRSARSVPDADPQRARLHGPERVAAYRNPRVASHSQYLLNDVQRHGGLPDGPPVRGRQGEAGRLQGVQAAASSSATAAAARSRCGAASAPPARAGA